MGEHVRQALCVAVTTRFFPPLCLSLYLDGTTRLPHRHPDWHHAFIIQLLLSSDLSVNEERFTDLATLPSKPWLLNLLDFMPASPNLCAGLLVEPPPHTPWRMARGQCLMCSCREKGRRRKSEKCWLHRNGHPHDVTVTVSAHSIVSVPDSHAASVT